MIEAILAAAQEGETVSKETLALISGGSAVFGALAGGFVAGVFNLRGERARQAFTRETRAHDEHREDGQQAALIRGTARQMRTSLRTASEFIRNFHNLGFFWDDDDDPGERLRLFSHVDDRRVVAGAATSDEWDAIEDAEAEVREVTQYRRLHLSVEQGRINRGEPRPHAPPGSTDPAYFDDTRKATLKTMIETIESGRHALDRLCH